MKHLLTLILALGLLATAGSVEAASRNPSRVSPGQGLQMSSLYFNGAAAVAVGNTNMGSTNDFSLEAWVKPTATGQSVGSIFTVGGQGQTGFRWLYISGANNTLSFQFATGATYKAVNSVSANLPVNQWSHVALVHRNGVGADFYVNGVKTSVAATEAMAFAADKATFLGGYSASSNKLTGYYGSIRVWNRALSDAEVTTMYGDYRIWPTGVTHSWPFLGNVLDSIGDNHGTITGAIFYSDAPRINLTPRSANRVGNRN